MNQKDLILQFVLQKPGISTSELIIKIIDTGLFKLDVFVTDIIELVKSEKITSINYTTNEVESRLYFPAGTTFEIDKLP